MGGAVRLSEVERWFGEKHNQRPTVLPWLGDSCMATQSGNRVAVINTRLNIVVAMYMFYPRFSQGNVQTGRVDLYLSIDPCHATGSQHPLIYCGCFERRMLRGAFHSIIADAFKDFSAAERAWIESGGANGWLSRVSPGLKLVWQHVLDQQRCRRKIYANPSGGGVLMDRLLTTAEKFVDTLPAYDSIARIRDACVYCAYLTHTLKRMHPCSPHHSPHPRSPHPRLPCHALTCSIML